MTRRWSGAPPATLILLSRFRERLGEGQRDTTGTRIRKRGDRRRRRTVGRIERGGGDGGEPARVRQAWGTLSPDRRDGSCRGCASKARRRSTATSSLWFPANRTARGHGRRPHL